MVLGKRSKWKVLAVLSGPPPADQLEGELKVVLKVANCVAIACNAARNAALESSSMGWCAKV